MHPTITCIYFDNTCVYTVLAFGAARVMMRPIRHTHRNLCARGRVGQKDVRGKRKGLGGLKKSGWIKIQEITTDYRDRKVLTILSKKII